MVDPEQCPFRIGNGDVHPFQGRGRGLLAGLFHDMHLHVVRYVHIRSTLVAEDYASFVEVLLDRSVDLFRPVRIQHLHFEISAVAALLPRIGVFQRGGFGHDRNIALSLAAPAPFELLLFAVLGGDLEISLVEPDFPLQPVKGVPLAHGPAYPVHERPDRIVARMSQLPLQFHGGNALFAVGHKGHGNVPCPDRQFGILHHRAAAQGRPGTTARTLPLSLGLEPIVLLPTTFLAYNALLFPDFTQMRAARILVGELFHKS